MKSIEKIISSTKKGIKGFYKDKPHFYFAAITTGFYMSYLIYNAVRGTN